MGCTLSVFLRRTKMRPLSFAYAERSRCLFIERRLGCSEHSFSRDASLCAGQRNRGTYRSLSLISRTDVPSSQHRWSSKRGACSWSQRASPNVMEFHDRLQRHCLQEGKVTHRCITDRTENFSGYHENPHK